MNTNLNAYDLMIKTNHFLIKSADFPQISSLTEHQKSIISQKLLAAKSDIKAVESFKNGVKAPEYLFSKNQSSDSRVMYPLFFIPPYNDGKKLQTVIPMSPKTHILSANSYELEILRLLYLLSPKNSDVKNMVEKTLQRLKSTCFGYHDCHDGECFHSALIVLRFLIAVSDDFDWISQLISFYDKYSGEKKRHSGTVWYYWLCLSELRFDVAKTEIEKYKSEMQNWLENKSCVMNSENDKKIHPVLFCILRNILKNYPEFEHIKSRQPYINEKDGRLYFDMKGENQ